MSTPAPEDLELLALRRRVAELEEAVETGQRTTALLAETEQRLRRLSDATRNGIVIVEDGHVVETNERLNSMYGYAEGELIGKGTLELVVSEVRDAARAHLLSKGGEPYETLGCRKDGSRFFLESQSRSILYRGRPARVAIIRDISERKRAEEALRAHMVQTSVIQAQEATLNELSTPLLPISDEVILLPLIGAVSAERAARVVEALVEGVARQKARTAILDITGVPDVDAQVAEALLRAARAAQLLGAEVVLTGIRPEVAQRFVQIGTDLTRIVTYGTLQRGVAHALARR